MAIWLSKLSYLLDPGVLGDIEECFGDKKDDYIGKNPLELLIYFEEWFTEQGTKPNSAFRQSVFNALKIIVHYANKPGQKDKILDFMNRVPGIRPEIADIFISAGYESVDDFERFVNPKCMGISTFNDLDLTDYDNDSKIALKKLFGDSEKNIQDLKDESVKIYDDILSKVDVSPRDAQSVWLAILAMLALEAQPEPPIGSNSRPPG